MAINFPNSPSLNQEAELGGKTYKWDGTKWVMTKVVTPTAQALAPTITEVSVTVDSITFTITNNDTESAVILYEVGDSTPDENSVELAGGTTSSNLTISGLTGDTAYVVSATATVVGKVTSNVGSATITTAVPITYTAATGGSAFETYDLQIVPNSTIDAFDVNQSNSLRYRTGYVEIINDSMIMTYTGTWSFGGIFWYDDSGGSMTHIGWHNLVSYDYRGQFLGTIPLNDFDKLQNYAPANATHFRITTRNENVITILSFSEAEGVGVVEYDEGGKRYRSHTFVQNGTFVVTQVGDADGDRNKVDYLIIAGGGGGSNGGGGAGGYRTTLGTSGGNSSAESKVTVTTQSYSVVVGSGGIGSTVANATSGSNSSAFAIISIGGGGSPYTNSNGFDGGSGGGAGLTTSANGTFNGGLGTANQGFNGGDTTRINPNYAGGGGGGAGSAGTDGTPNTPGNGGSGLSNLIRTGSNETRAVGGHGFANPGTVIGTGIAVAQSNTGNGGGGAYNSVGNNGGSGIVIIRYEIAPSV